jgi:hypothetical protein
MVEAVALPFCRWKWKQSTAATTENRIRHHLIVEFGRICWLFASENPAKPMWRDNVWTGNPAQSSLKTLF